MVLTSKFSARHTCSILEYSSSCDNNYQYTNYSTVLLAKMEFVFKLLGPLAPQPVKDVIRKIVNERKSEIIQALKVGGGALIKILIEIWRKALLGSFLG